MLDEMSVCEKLCCGNLTAVWVAKTKLKSSANYDETNFIKLAMAKVLVKY